MATEAAETHSRSREIAPPIQDAGRIERHAAPSGGTGVVDCFGESLCRAPDWDATARVLGSCADPRRMAFATDPNFVFDLLQRDAHTLGVG